MATENIYFLEFHLNLKTRELFRGEVALPITHLGFEVLHHLIQHAGQLVGRDQLADHAWKNKVITDATLYKQIQRLRKVLGDTDENKRIIQTVHGQGFIFLPAVSEHPAQSNQANQQRNWAPIGWLSAVLLGVLLMVLWWRWAPSPQAPLNEAVQSSQTQPTKPLIISVLPNANTAATNPPSWVLTGGMSYLIEKYQDDPAININRLPKTQLFNTDATSQAIQLTHDDTIDAALIFQVIEDQDQFSAEVMLRNDDGVLAEQSFQSVSVKTLFDEIHSWSHQQLTDSRLTADPNPTLSEDRYAVENFIRGMGAQYAGQAAEAIQYFELATHEDPQFWKAWYELAIALRKQGKHRQSLSILDTLIQTDDAQSLHFGARNARALVLWRLGQHPQALQAMDEVIEMALTKAYPRMYLFYTNKAIIATELGDLPLAEQAIKQSIDDLLAQPQKSHRSLGTAYNTLAGINLQSGDYHSAKDHAQLAIDAFNTAGETRYHLTAQSRLASVHIALGELGVAESMVENLLQDQQQVADVSGQISNWVKIANINLLVGKHTKVRRALDQMAMLFDETSNDFLFSQYLDARIRFYMQTDQWHQVPHLMEQLQQHLISSETELGFHDLQFRNWQHEAAWDRIAEALEQLDPALKQHAMSDFWRAQLASAQMQHSKALSAMHNALQKAAADPAARDWQIRIINALALMSLPDDPLEAWSLVNQCAALNPPPYPFLKIKAQVKAAEGHWFAAASLLKELKLNAHDHWTVADQQLLEHHQQQLDGMTR